ncbi:hypothetical protein GJ700_03980 [Duganella sp. FT92W]|uniref:Uncharacterized protein n=1 Tax=Pseudoduganella rivuli TaxID=2666085 RepID=A0A7X2LRJ4_9BURK|nr:protease complex subunit PrcB family protein [Pseudoduganella rivuli]MRV70878.1 hypothetical protein [Pseudoduganella rivuli]
MIKLAGLKQSSLRLEPMALALAALVSLSACGGGGDAPQMSAAVTPGTQGIAVGEPNPSAQVDKNVFIKMAQGAACSDKRNRLYIIDNAQVFWDVAGSCADASYSQTLFGATPDKVLCRSYDSIAGPRTSCTNPDPAALEGFGGIIKNLDKPNLGMDSTHKVEIVDLTPQVKLGNTVQFEQLIVNQYSGNSTLENLTVRDAKGWSEMWKRINANMTELPPEPWVDFSKKMVAVIFAGNASNGCSGVGVVRASEQDGVLHVEYANAPEPEPGVMCTMAITSPVTAVVVDKFDNVKFDQIKATPVKFKRIETQLSTTDQTAPFTAVVSDELKLRKLWNQYVDAATVMPSIDFSTQTVLFAWGGLGMTCQSTTFTGVLRAGGKLYASVQNRTPGPATDCIMGVKGAGDVVIIDRSDEPVVFSSSVVQF